ncbi:YwiC-like family protein [Anaerolineales bacterium HSG25]|nr:YwiC-like family protein [Anaerolineales bacterium HSG25]
MKPPLPREHGAWVMLFTPLTLGWLLAPVWQAQISLFFVASLSFFLLRHPLTVFVKRWNRPSKDWQYLQRWAVIYGGITVISGGWLVFINQFWWLLPAALLGGLLLLFNLWLVSKRQDMSVVGELTGIFGLAMGAPMAYYVSSGQFAPLAFLLWLINFLYFGGTVFYVKLKVRQQPRLPEPESVLDRFLQAKVCLGYQLLVFAILTVLILQNDFLVWGTYLIFVPATLKMVWGAWQWQDKKSLNLKRLGMIELVHTFIFAGLVWAVAIYG